MSYKLAGVIWNDDGTLATTEMKEPLEALERVKEYRLEFLTKFEEAMPIELNIIENALKDYERRLKLAKEYEDVNNVAKRLKALEIVKEHFVNIGGARGNFEGKKPTNEIVITLKDLTQEEYESLKEILH